MLRSVDQIVVRVQDIDAARRLFISVIGRTPAWEGSLPGVGVSHCLFRLRNTSIQLLSPTGEGVGAERLRNELEESGEGLREIVLETEDLGAAIRRLRAHGIDPGEPVAELSHDAASGAFRRFRSVELPSSETGGVRLKIVAHHGLPDELARSLPLADQAASASAVDHVVVMTQAPDRARQLYGDILGIRLALDRTFADRGLRLMFFRLAGLTIEVGAQIKEGAELAAPPADSDLLWGLALEVPNAEAARARCAAAGVEVSEIRPGHKPGTRVFTVRGSPNGVATLMIEPVAKTEGASGGRASETR